MQPETQTEQRDAVRADVRHSLGEKDREAVAAMRKEIASFKSKMSDPSAHPPSEEVMEHTPEARGVTYEKAVVGGVPGISCTPESARPGAKILYLHGGAYVLGSANAYRHLAGQIAARANAAVFIAEYRLAPEHRFPAALDDARAVYRGLVEGGAGKIAIVGASAGGVEAVAHVWEGMTHVFPSSVGTLEAAEKALSLMATFLDERLSAQPEAVGSPKARGQA